MRVLLVHNRYRIQGGEERSVELQLDALRRAGVAHALLERSSAELSRSHAARALLRGGQGEDDVETAARELDADVVHVHNMLPLPGPRGLEAARGAGASVLLHLHNLRLFCAIGVAARDGGPCFRCHHRNTLPGLALNCRGSLPEAAVYAAALARHQPTVFAAADRLDVLPHYLPAEAFAEHSRADHGGYALVASRLSPEKGIGTAIEAAAATGIPLRVAGEGPAAVELTALAERSGAPVEFIGRVGRASVARELAGAAMLLMPSRYHEFAPYSALEAMAAGVPVIACALGGLPEMIGANRCVSPNDPAALAARMTLLWGDRDLRVADGQELIARARTKHDEARYTERLLDLYGRVASGARSG